MSAPPANERDEPAQPFTIILGDGLEEEVIGPHVRHLDSRSHIGERELERLCGRGRTYGQGPLPTFLQAAIERRERGEAVAVVLLARADDATSDRAGAEPIRFGPALEPVAARSRVIACPVDHIPFEELRGAILEESGIDPAAPGSGARLRFLVVGCHTEGRVMALALVLRLLFRCEKVAISHHLTASAIPEAHLATLRHTLPQLGVEVLLDIDEVLRFANLLPEDFRGRVAACRLEPEELVGQLGPEPRQIVERLCMHWTRARLRPLKGGFSGSLLLMAEGWKGEARTEPMVLKIDAFRQMRKELAGYYTIKDFLGKNVPTFGYPVSVGEWLGVGMELAAKDGTADTLQDSFQRAEDEDTTRRYFERLDKALELLVEKLLRNTLERRWVAPYRDLGLHTEQQQRWLRKNAELVQAYLAEAGLDAGGVDVDSLVTIFALITGNQNGLDGEVCLVHGDLNFANIICDQRDNVWMIDWTHCATMPLELDFAKLENDVKFVMNSSFELEDLPRLRKIETFFLQNRLIPRPEQLPAELSFVKWDLRLRKLFGTVRRVREALFSLKQDEDWTTYRVALLRYAAHTLSFDARRGRGECTVVQLASALHSVNELAYDLFSDPFHMRIRAERPEEYPIRHSLTVDEAPWSRPCRGYAPPYYVAPAVLEGHGPGGWADPEDFERIAEELAARPAEHRDEKGRPLNPSGRTGIAGRGLLGLWGRNLSVAAVVVRPVEDGRGFEVVLGQEPGQTRLELPKGFVLPGESPADGIRRILAAETGARPTREGEVVVEESTFDARQTDHAWVETRVLLWHDLEREFPDLLVAGGDFEEIDWWPLEPDTVNRVPSDQAQFLRECVERLSASGRLEAGFASRLLAHTG